MDYPTNIKLDGFGSFAIREDTLTARIRSLEMIQPEERMNGISGGYVIDCLSAVCGGITLTEINLFQGKIKNHGDLLDVLYRMRDAPGKVIPVR